MDTIDLTSIFVFDSRRRPANKTLNQPFTFCGVTRWVKDWVRSSKLNPDVIIDRVERQGLSIQDALTKPSRKGNHLRPVTPDEFAAFAKAYRKERTYVLTKGGIPGHQVMLETTKGSVDLGSYESLSEATLALNTAKALFPKEWLPEDQQPINRPVSPEAAVRIRNTVTSLLSGRSPECNSDPERELDFGNV